ncbi:hypothetical protein TrST_g12408 [Triparma strigata]|uniref:Uncharacterized protein n=1 Tax=Triparma strigata TaxID=1606541 RepID=A0A9W7EBK1_9STRA|nr:hypothetical protein TrST_g12408 [Triparma strigata]
MEFSSSATATLSSLKSRDPYSNWTLSHYINSSGSKLLFLKKRGLAVHTTPQKCIWLRAKDKAVCGSEVPFVEPVTVLVTGDMKVRTEARRGLSSSYKSDGGNFSGRCNALLEKMKRNDWTDINFDYFMDTSSPHFPFVAVFVAVCLLVFIKILSRLRSFLWLVPVYFLLKSTVPTMESFDAKKELKRILRKENLPDNHPEKPKGWLGKMASKAIASVAGEAMTAAGYTIKFDDFAGIVRIAEVELDVDKSTLVWVGVVNKWYFLKQVPAEEKKKKQ